MEKLLSVILKSILFFIGWALISTIIPIPYFENNAVWRFFAELIPFLSIVFFTLIFLGIEKKQVDLCLLTDPIRNGVIGILTGALWLGISVGILMVFGVIHFEGINKVPLLYLWIFSAFINTVMQELLVRGYLYQMIKKNYNIIAAVAVSTAIFTLAHGEAFQAGIIPVMNVLTMSLFMSAVLEFTCSLFAPIIIHFLWNSIGAIILGGVALADDYPHLLNMKFSRSTLLSGGACKIEGSVVVLTLNIIFMTVFVWALRKKVGTTKLQDY